MTTQEKLTALLHRITKDGNSTDEVEELIHKAYEACYYDVKEHIEDYANDPDIEIVEYVEWPAHPERDYSLGVTKDLFIKKVKLEDERWLEYHYEYER